MHTADPMKAAPLRSWLFRWADRVTTVVACIAIGLAASFGALFGLQLIVGVINLAKSACL